MAAAGRSAVPKMTTPTDAGAVLRLNRATGITFDEAIQDGLAFELEGCRVPVIGLAALLKNKQAAGREQDLADLTRSRSHPRTPPAASVGRGGSCPWGGPRAVAPAERL